MVGETEWVLRSHEPEAVDNLQASLNCPAPLATVLANRRITDPEQARRYLSPSEAEFHPPGTLPDVATAVDRLERGLDDDSIVVYADRDVDGSCGGALLVKCLSDLGGTVESEVPGKWAGYGLNEEAIADLADRGADLLLTVDCGTTAHTELRQANEAGIDVIVTDHHEPEDHLPAAIACVNPRREDSQYPNANLAGGAVAYKLGRALVETVTPDQVDTYHRYALPLAALATVGDYMALNLENRAIVREGYRRFQDCGLPGLITAADHRDVDSVRDLSWRLTPFLNASQEDEAGGLMVELLLADDQDRIATIIELLEEYREDRKRDREVREEHLEACFEDQVNPEQDDLFLIETDRYVGGVPTVHLSEQWGRPVITYRRTNGEYKGGGRSDPDVDFLEIYEYCADHIEEYWGHPGAAGFRVNAENIDHLKRAFVEAVDTLYEPADFRPTLEIDVGLNPDHVDRQLVEALDQLQPFGPANEEPAFLIESIDIARYDRFGDGDRHCKLQPSNTDAFTVIYWDGGNAIAEINHPTTYDIVGTLGIDDYEQLPAVTVSDYRVVSESQTRLP